MSEIVVPRRRTAALPSYEAVVTPCVDGPPLSSADVERNIEVAVARGRQLRQAVYAVAAHADDADQCRTLLEMLGIDVDTARAARAIGQTDSAQAGTGKPRIHGSSSAAAS